MNSRASVEASLAAGERTADVLFWPVVIALGCALPFVFTSDYFASIAILFALYASMNLMWTLVIGVAGIFSFATLAIVGTAAYAAAKLGGGTRTFTIDRHAQPIWVMLLASVLVGLIGGLIVAAPSIRLRGVYFLLFTFGLVQLCSAVVLNSDTFGYANGLTGVNGFVSENDLGTDRARLVPYFAAMALFGLMLVVYFLVNRGRLGLLLRTARESEPVARALGINVTGVRLLVFLISSSGLGLVGGMYAGLYGTVSPTIFSIDTLLLLFAMMVIGGLGSARGVVLGVIVVLFLDQKLVEHGAIRFVAIGCLMLAIPLFADRGLVGIREQLRARLLRRGS